MTSCAIKQKTQRQSPYLIRASAKSCFATRSQWNQLGKGFIENLNRESQLRTSAENLGNRITEEHLAALR